jgi:putative membrane protein
MKRLHFYFITIKKSIMSMKGILFAVLLFAACNNKNDDDNTTLNGTDEQFMQQVSYSNHDEIAAAQIALVRASADSVKVFAQMMISNHTIAQESLDSLGGQFNMQLPQTADSAHFALGQQLQTLSGAVFDTTYMGAQVRDHQLTVSVFQNEINSGNNAQVKAYASKNLPMIEEHLQMATRILAQLQ